MSDRIELNLTLRHAAGEGESAREESLSALGSLQISLSSGGSGIAGDDYEVQGTTVVFQPDVVTAGQEITVTVSAVSYTHLDVYKRQAFHREIHRIW